VQQSIAQANDRVDEISESTNEQTTGINEVSRAVSELDTLTQQNAQMVNDTSTSAEQVRAAMATLNEQLSAFTLSEAPEKPTRTPERGNGAPRTKPRPQATTAGAGQRGSASRDVGEWESF
jgi:methyl-accepting chemotaxis protein